jgi:hypothetical protein
VAASVAPNAKWMQTRRTIFRKLAKGCPPWLPILCCHAGAAFSAPKIRSFRNRLQKRPSSLIRPRHMAHTGEMLDSRHAHTLIVGLTSEQILLGWSRVASFINFRIGARYQIRGPFSDILMQSHSIVLLKCLSLVASCHSLVGHRRWA